MRGDWYCDEDCNVAECNSDAGCLSASSYDFDPDATEELCEAAGGIWNDPCAPPPPPPAEPWWPEDWVWEICSSELDDCWTEGAEAEGQIETSKAEEK